MAASGQNYTLGRGKVSFAKHLTGTQSPDGFRYIGNTPEVNITVESENLDHYSSDGGIREKDCSIVLEVTRSGTLITDNIHAENLALFFFGSASTVTTVAATGLTSDINSVVLGNQYQLGVEVATPIGIMGLDPATIDVQPDGGGTAFVEGTDYTFNSEMGLLTILATGTIVAGADLDVTFDTLSSTRDRIISGDSAVEGALIYEAFNPTGENYHLHLPYVKITPNGDFSLKSDEFQQLPFTLEILKPDAAEAIYIDGKPV